MDPELEAFIPLFPKADLSDPVKERKALAELAAAVPAPDTANLEIEDRLVPADPDVPVRLQWPADDPVEIGAGSWLGAGAVVLPGSRLGRNTVVAAGSVVRRGTPVQVWTAVAPSVTVPDVRGQNQAAADATLTNARLSLGRIAERPSERPVGTIVEQMPAPGTAAAACPFVDASNVGKSP